MNPRVLTQALLLGLVACLVAAPLAVLLLASVTPHGSLPFQTAHLTFANFATIATEPGTVRLLFDTFAYALGSVVLALAMAVGLAWLVERSDLGGGVVIRTFMLAWMAVPPVVFGYGWILLVNPGNGLLNDLLRWLLRLHAAPLSPYSMTALIVISAMMLVPTCFTMVAGLLRNMDPVLEDAGRVLGAHAGRVAARITLPLLTPGLLSVLVFLVMAMVQAFDLPLIIGLTARIPLLSTRIFLASSPDSGVPDYGIAAAWGVVLLLLAVVLLWLYFRAIRHGDRFRVVGGKGFRPRRARLGPMARAAAVTAIGLYALAMLLPLLILAWMSLLPFYRAPSLAALASVSLDNYRAILGESEVRRAIANTVLLFLVSATTVMLLSGLIAWFSLRGRGWAGRLLDALSFAPIAVPPIVLATAILLVSIGTPLYGTIWVLVIGHVTIFLAFGTRTMHGALIQLDRELENAALISGASWATSLRRIVLPLVWPQLLDGWLWVVAHSARDLTFGLMLMTSGNIIAAASIFLMWDEPNLPGAAALSMLLVAGLMLLVVPIQIHASRRMASRV
jgi:iron(III) transport system permease protein